MSDSLIRLLLAINRERLRRSRSGRSSSVGGRSFSSRSSRSFGGRSGRRFSSRSGSSGFFLLGAGAQNQSSEHGGDSEFCVHVFNPELVELKFKFTDLKRNA
jgi:hypothetical protein